MNRQDEIISGISVQADHAALNSAPAAAAVCRAQIALETNRATFRHELKVRFWPGGGEGHVLGEAHAHGAWVEWLG